MTEVTEALLKEVRDLYQTVAGVPYTKPERPAGVAEHALDNDPVLHLYADISRLRWLLASNPNYAGKVQTAFSPCTDVTLQDEDIVVNLDLAGVPREEIEILVWDRTLVVRGNRKPTPCQEGCRVLSEHPVGPFERVIAFARPLMGHSVRACMDQGVLEIRVCRRANGNHEPASYQVEIR